MKNLSAKYLAELGAVGLFIGLAGWITWPLAIQPAEAIFGPPGDNLYYAWLIDWFYQALFRLHSNPFLVPIHNYPYGWELAYTETTLANVLPALPINWLGGPILAYNSILLISIVLSGYIVYRWVTDLTGSRSAGLVSGSLLAASPYQSMHALGHLPLMGTAFLGLHYFGFSRLMREDWFSWKWAALTGLGFGLAALSSMYYLYMTVVITSLAGLLYFFLVDRKPIWKPNFWKNILAAAAIALPLIVLALAPFISLAARDSANHRRLAVVDAFSASPTDFIAPAANHPFWGSWMQVYFPRPLLVEQNLYVGVVAIGLALVALAGFGSAAKTRRFNRWLLAVAIAGFVLALGTSLHWRGQPVTITLPAYLRGLATRGRLTIPLPNRLLFDYLPFYDGMRAWARYGIYVQLFLAALAGIGFAALRQRVRAWVAVIALTAAVLLIIALDFAPGPATFSTLTENPAMLWLDSQAEPGAYAWFPIKLSLKSENIYQTLSNDRPFLGMFPGGYLPASFQQDWARLRNFPDPGSLKVLEQRQIRYALIDTSEYADWTSTAAELSELGLRQIARIGRVSVYAIGNP
jgi:hypothetical protein